MMKTQNIYILLLAVLSIQFIQSQCYPDRHSTSWYDGWVSCEVSQNPIASYGETHWIMYDLGYDYVLNETKFWNANEPKNLNFGINAFHLDYSLDGVTWTNLGEFNMEQASGLSTYEGDEGPDFNAVKARYVLVTPNSNYGGNCYGLSELKISITDPFLVIDEEDGFNASVYPNPFVDNITLRLVALDESIPLDYTLYDILGRSITSNNITMYAGNETYNLELNGSSLSIGVYILKIIQNGKEQSFKLIKKK
ncbi:T9SS type A sorting domain-containing protein [uncultured Algibacter sp.]|uniref:T9SS type A sorting domain-containing protein n=1 Tax=uncultured Algibacter sp. TaxID=298659 RepID=UPI002623AD43|nr:T9SS type A sorting domain-containing protein [uncultured Algibacter sp.]